MSRTTFEPWVYAWPQSALAGERVGIHAAGSRVTAQRITRNLLDRGLAG